MPVIKDALQDAETKMQKTVEIFSRELAGMRAGRAHPAMLDKVMVDYYGTSTPLGHLGQVSVPEARVLLIQPYDKAAVPAIEKAIQKADLGLGIRIDGTVLRLSVPSLTEERRRDLVKQLKRRVEDEKVALRNVRRDGHEAIKALERDKSVSEDEGRRALDQLQKLTDRYTREIDELGALKERDLLQP